MISIIIPFYNTEKYIEKCLSSIKAQTFSDYECLMIDDGSTDSSREIASKFLVDSRFKLLNKEHVGFPKAKNIGLDNAKGEYICFVDSDDFINEYYLEYLYKGLKESQSDICCCNFRCFTDINTLKIKNSSQLIYITKYADDKMIKLFSPCTTFMWNKIYKREVFNDVRFSNVEALSDTMVMYKLFEKAKVCYISNVLIYYRRHNENMTFKVRNFSPTYWEHRLTVYLTMCNYLYKNYRQYAKIYRDMFKHEFCEHIKPHLSEETYNKYLEKEEVKQLLEII